MRPDFIGTAERVRLAVKPVFEMIGQCAPAPLVDDVLGTITELLTQGLPELLVVKSVRLPGTDVIEDDEGGRVVNDRDDLAAAPGNIPQSGIDISVERIAREEEDMCLVGLGHAFNRGQANNPKSEQIAR